VLAVKLQEMFGLARTPAIAEGRSPLRIHAMKKPRRLARAGFGAKAVR